MRVALFITCIGDTVTPEVGRSTVAVLERLGHEVAFPAGQRVTVRGVVNGELLRAVLQELSRC